MNKNRPELINLTSPISCAENIQNMLLEVLAKAAKLKRIDQSGETKFSFHPTKSEYFLISVKLACMAKQQ